MLAKRKRVGAGSEPFAFSEFRAMVAAKTFFPSCNTPIFTPRVPFLLLSQNL
jgi:hypothetical protein